MVMIEILQTRQRETSFSYQLREKETHEIWPAPENPRCPITVSVGTASPSV